LNEGLADDVDAEAEEVLNELNLLTETEDAGSDIHSQGDPADWGRYLHCISMCQSEKKWFCNGNLAVKGLSENVVGSNLCATTI
jgi:hypothetical protein